MASGSRLRANWSVHLTREPLTAATQDAEGTHCGHKRMEDGGQEPGNLRNPGEKRRWDSRACLLSEFYRAGMPANCKQPGLPGRSAADLLPSRYASL